MAQPQAPDARRRDLPQRDPRLVPRRHGVGARHDRHRRVPADPRHHRDTTSATARRARKAYGELGHANPGDILVPTLADLWSDATDDRAWVGELGYQVWHLGMLGYGGVPDEATSARSPMYWDESGDPQDWRSQNDELYRLPAVMPPLDAFASYRDAYVPNPDRNPEFDPVKPKNLHCCSTPVIRYQGDLVEATLANEPVGSSGRAGPPVHQLQGPRLHRSRLRDVRPDDGRRAPRRRRAARPARRAAGRALPGPVRADRHGRPRSMPAPRRVGRRPPRPDPALGRPRARVRRRPVRPRPERRAVRGVPARRRAVGRRARRARTWPRSSATTRIGGTSGRTCPGRDRTGSARPAAVRRGVRDLVPRHARGPRPRGRLRPRHLSAKPIPPGSPRPSPDESRARAERSSTSSTANAAKARRSRCGSS